MDPHSSIARHNRCCSSSSDRTSGIRSVLRHVLAVGSFFGFSNCIRKFLTSSPSMRAAPRFLNPPVGGERSPVENFRTFWARRWSLRSIWKNSFGAIDDAGTFTSSVCTSQSSMSIGDSMLVSQMYWGLSKAWAPSGKVFLNPA